MRRGAEKAASGSQKDDFFEGGSEEDPKKRPADLKEEMWEGDKGWVQKRVFLGCKKHAFSGPEEELKKLQRSPKRRFFLRGDQKRSRKSRQRKRKRRFFLRGIQKRS